jgi:carboxyl-terminal processing protease
MAALGAAVLVVACAGTDQPGAASDFDTYDAGRLFSVGYKDIADIYIDEVEIRGMAVAGLKGLNAVDPDLKVRSDADAIRVVHAERAADRYAAPSNATADAWGRLTARVLRDQLKRSPELRAHPPERLYEAVFEGVIGRLDGFSRYAGAEQAQDNRAHRDGFGGIGVTVEATPAGVRVHGVDDGGPADRAGVRDGDLIVQVDGRATAGLGQRTIVDLLRGRVDSAVDLVVHRDGAEGRFETTVQRAHIVPDTVAYERRRDAAYIRITGFNQDTTHALRQAVTRATREIGPALTGYILDLRGNPGGLLDQAVDVSDLFVTDGRIVSTHGRHPDSHQYFSARPDDVADGHPVVVLIDSGSASAAEIVAAAIQDSGRGLVVGSVSYGKGTVQTVLRLPNRGELTLTWARFHAPSGYALAKRGVLPDICTSDGADTADAVAAALRDGDLPIAGQLRQRTVLADDDIAVTDLRAACPARHSHGNGDVEIALRLLGNAELYRLASGRPVGASLAKAADR